MIESNVSWCMISNYLSPHSLPHRTLTVIQIEFINIRGCEVQIFAACCVYPGHEGCGFPWMRLFDGWLIFSGDNSKVRKCCRLLSTVIVTSLLCCGRGFRLSFSNIQHKVTDSLLKQLKLTVFERELWNFTLFFCSADLLSTQPIAITFCRSYSIFFCIFIFCLLFSVTCPVTLRSAPKNCLAALQTCLNIMSLFLLLLSLPPYALRPAVLRAAVLHRK